MYVLFFCSTVDIYIIPVLCKLVNFSFYFLQHFNNYSHFFYNLYIIFFILVESIIYLHIKKNHIISEWFPSQFRSALFIFIHYPTFSAMIKPIAEAKIPSPTLVNLSGSNVLDTIIPHISVLCHKIHSQKIAVNTKPIKPNAVAPLALLCVKIYATTAATKIFTIHI